MSFEIQKHFFCENCKICGTRPVIDQSRKVWTIRCPTIGCKSTAVIDSFINIEQWNNQNRSEDFGKVVSGNFKNRA